MVAMERINVRETVGRTNNCKLNLFSMHFIRNNKEIHLPFKNSEKQQTQAVSITMDFVEKHQQVEFPLIGTNMKRGYFAGCTMSKILLLSSFNVILEYINYVGLPWYTLSTRKSMPVLHTFINYASLITTSTLATNIALLRTVVAIKAVQ